MNYKRVKAAPERFLFPRTTLVRCGEMWLVYDRQGRVVLPVTMFLLHLQAYGRAPHTIRQYGGQIVSIMRILEISAIELFDVSDATLLLLRQHALSVRRVKVRSWKNALSIFLRMLVFAQSQGFCRNVVGVNSEGSKVYRVSRLPGEGIQHELLNERGEGRQLAVLPSDSDFATMEAELVSAGSWALTKQRHAMVELLHGGPFRRSELVKFAKDDLPSAAEFRQLVEGLRKSGGPPVLEITYWRAKKHADRRVRAKLTVSLVGQLIEFRDRIRPRLLKEGLDPPELFVSSKTGRGYCPQSFTNLVKAAARTAGSRFGSHLNSIHPHHYRHRSATTKLKEYLLSGMEVGKAFLLVQDEMDVTFDVMCGYLHLARMEMSEGSPEFQRAAQAADDLAMMRRGLSEKFEFDPRRPRRRR